MKKGYFNHFQTYSFLCCSRKELEIVHHMLVIRSLVRLINDQIMKRPQISDFYNTLKKNTTVACVVDDSHTVER